MNKENAKPVRPDEETLNSYIGKDYSAVEKALEKLGFTNISWLECYDSKAREGAVCGVEIADNDAVTIFFSSQAANLVR